MKKNAFTIIETLTTLLAITIMITAPLTFMYRSYKYSEFINSKVISLGLAQEGIELVTAYRNNNLANFKSKALECSSSCMVDWDGQSLTPTITVCSGDSCKLYGNTSDINNPELYRSSGDKDTGQHRSIKLSPNGAGGYLLESTAWSYVESIKVEAKLSKMIFELDIKNKN
jgi:hypothetical protein